MFSTSLRKYRDEKENNLFTLIIEWKFSLLMPSLHQQLVLVLILVPRGHAPFDQHQESRPPDRSSGILVLIGFANKFVRFDPEHAQSDEKSMNRGLPVLEPVRGRDSWC